MVKHILLNNMTLIVDLEKEHVVASTAGCSKIFSEIRYIVFKTVSKDLGFVDLDRYCGEISNSIGLDYAKTIIFLTAVDVSSYSHSEVVLGNVKAEAFVTYGVDIYSCIGGDKNSGIGTINIAVVVDKPLDYVGLLDLFRVISEAKGMAISLGGPTCISGASLGTASDAIAVVAPRGSERFAGIATDVGIASTIATLNALAKQIRKTSRDHYLAKTLGLSSIDELVNIAMDVYKRAKIPCINENQIILDIRNEIQRLLEDPNIAMFIRGLRLLEIALSLGIVPVIDLDEYRLDSPGIIIDELAGKAIAEYINGFKGLLSYYWIERLKKHGELKAIASLPPVTDDIIGAVIGGILSKIYDKYSRFCPQ